MRAEDILPDDIDQADYNGVTVRKGSIAAFLATAAVFTDIGATAEARARRERDMITAMPVLYAVVCSMSRAAQRNGPCRCRRAQASR